MTVPRRSRRIASRNNRQIVSKTNGRASRGGSSSTVSSVDLDILEATISEHITKARESVASKRITRSSTISKVSAEDTDSDDDDGYDNESGSSSAKSIYSTIERIITRRKASQDSRYDSGNEDYELDDFVVDDNASISSTSDDTIIAARSPTTTSSNTRSASAHSIAHSTAHSSASKTTRRSSNSTSSRLFFSDSGDGAKPHDMVAWLELGVTSDDPEDAGAELIAEPSAEIAEEISDAVAMFSRRCNMEKAPVRLRLASVVGRDEEVKDALDWAVELGLGRKLVLKDGSSLWTIGPKAT